MRRHAPWIQIQPLPNEMELSLNVKNLIEEPDFAARISPGHSHEFRFHRLYRWHHTSFLVAAPVWNTSPKASGKLSACVRIVRVVFITSVTCARRGNFVQWLPNGLSNKPWRSRRPCKLEEIPTQNPNIDILSAKECSTKSILAGHWWWLWKKACAEEPCTAITWNDRYLLKRNHLSWSPWRALSSPGRSHLQLLQKCSTILPSSSWRIDPASASEARPVDLWSWPLRHECWRVGKRQTMRPARWDTHGQQRKRGGRTEARQTQQVAITECSQYTCT